MDISELTAQNGRANTLMEMDTLGKFPAIFLLLFCFKGKQLLELSVHRVPLGEGLL